MNVPNALSALLTSSQPYMLPMTGGEGSIIITVVGLSMAGLSLVLLLVLSRKGKKPKGKPKGGNRG